MSERCMMYIDGYNFYYSIKDHPGTTPIHLGWCDFRELACQFMIPDGAVLQGIKYFTAPVGSLGKPDGEAARQRVWLEAAKSIEGLQIVTGYHSGTTYSDRREKETDVNLAISAVIDAKHNRFDRAILVTGDGDQHPTVRALAEEFGKKVDVWIPPNHETSHWKAAAAYKGVRVKEITVKMLSRSRLPEIVIVDGREVAALRIWQDR